MAKRHGGRDRKAWRRTPVTSIEVPGELWWSSSSSIVNAGQYGLKTASDGWNFNKKSLTIGTKFLEPEPGSFYAGLVTHNEFVDRSPQGDDPESKAIKVLRSKAWKKLKAGNVRFEDYLGPVLLLAAASKIKSKAKKGDIIQYCLTDKEREAILIPLGARELRSVERADKKNRRARFERRMRGLIEQELIAHPDWTEQQATTYIANRYISQIEALGGVQIPIVTRKHGIQGIQRPPKKLDKSEFTIGTEFTPDPIFPISKGTAGVDTRHRTQGGSIKSKPFAQDGHR